MNCVLISPIASDNSDGAHRPAQLARELAARGNAVVYVEIEKSRKTPETTNPRLFTFQDLGWADLELLRAWYGFSYTAPNHSSLALLEALGATDQPGVVICSAPFRPALALLPLFAERGYAIVYDVLDDISEMRALGSYCYDDIAEAYLAQQADLIVTLSPRLSEKFRAHPNVRLIRDGVALAPFRDATLLQAYSAQNGSDILRLEQGELTIGFWGTMWDYNLDVPLLQTVARARPQWQWHFIGAYDLDPTRPSLARALDAPNVHFHSSVTRATLARAARSFDVCILPTPVTPFNLARDPLKVYEYLACYKPVVATNLTQLADMPYVWLARDAAEFVQDIEHAAQQKIDRTELDGYLAEQTWAKRTETLVQAITSLPHPPRTLPPPPSGAMTGAEQDLARWQAYTQHLERLVQDREQHISDLERALADSGIARKIKRVLKQNPH